MPSWPLKVVAIRRLVLLVLAACASASPPPAAPKPVAVRPTCTPLGTDGDAELAPIAAVVGSARVVALGEATHADGAAFATKARIVRYLHDRLGFEVLAFESSLWACESGAVSCLAWPWAEAKEVDGLLAWATAQRMHVTGFDPQLTGGAPRLETLEKWIGDRLAPDAPLAGRLRVAFARYPKMGKFRLLSVEDRRVDETAFHEARTLAAARDDALLVRTLDDVLVVYAWHAAVGADRSTTIDWDGQAAMNDVRDHGMADDVRWLLDVRYPGKKLVLWTANTHAAKDAPAVELAGFRGYRTMGSWLATALGKDYVALAATAFEGRTGNPPMAERDLGPAPAGAIETTCAAPLALVRLDEEPRVGRFIGYEPLRAPWKRIFDAGIFIRTMTPVTR